MPKFIVLTLVAAFAVVAHGIGIPPVVTTPPNVNIFGICKTAAAAATQGLPTITQLPGVTTAGLPNTCKTAEELNLMKCTQIPSPLLTDGTLATSAVLGYTCDLSADKVYDAAGKEVSNPSVVIDQNGNAVVKSGQNQVVSGAVVDDASGKAVGITDSAGKYYSLANAKADSATGVITDNNGAPITTLSTSEYTIKTKSDGNIISITPV